MDQIVEYNVTDAAIAEMESLYMGLTIAGLDDNKGFDAVHDARMIVKGKRVEVEKRRKELKADALAWGKKVDSEAKRIFSLIEPIETHLKTEEEKVTKERQRIKEEEDRKEREKIQERINQLAKFGAVLPFQDVAVMSDDEFVAILNESKEAHEDEQERIAKEEAERKAEGERLAKLREEQEAEAARLRAEQDKQDAERRKIEAEKAKLEAEKKAEQERRDREAFERKAKEEARIKAEREAKEQAEREAKEKELAERRAKEEAERQEALKPDREKLLAFAVRIKDLTAFNIDLKSPGSRELFHKTIDAIMKIEDIFRREIKEL